MSGRSAQNVSTKSQRKQVIDWMISEVMHSGTEKKISVKAVENFPSIFKVTDHRTRTCCIQKAYRWYIGRSEFLAALQTPENRHMTVAVTNKTGVSVKRVSVKALAGRGRKRQDWTEYLHSMLLMEFERYTASGVQMSRPLLQSIAVNLLQEPDSAFNADEVDSGSNKPISSLITPWWIGAFMSRFNIVIRKQSGSLQRSPSHTRFIERTVAYHLGQVQRLFEVGDMDENMVENMDETHFIYNMGDHKTLSIRGDKKVNYADVVSGGDGFTMALRLRGGVSARLEDPFLIFKNRDRNYPMANLQDNVPGVSYRTQPRGWMDNETFCQWLEESRVIAADTQGRSRILYLDNCSGHKQTETV